MNVTWKYVKPLQEKDSVKLFLDSNNICLPDDLVRILEENNGGRPSEKAVITDTNREYVFKSLLSYNKGDLETIYSFFPELFVDTTLYPIGSDSAGNFICFDYKANKYVLLNHETNKVEMIKQMNWLP